jgi:hypothetical protein
MNSSSLSAMLSKTCTVAVLSLAILSSEPSQAELITWKLEGVHFDDGGTAVGTFTVDTAKGTDQRLTAFDITTTSGSVISTPFAYAPSSTNARYHLVEISNEVGTFSIPELEFSFKNHFLMLSLESDIHDVTMPGAATGFITNEPSGEANAEEQLLDANFSALIRHVDAGQVVASIPEPSVLVYLGVAFAVIARAFAWRGSKA